MAGCSGRAVASGEGEGGDGGGSTATSDGDGDDGGGDDGDGDDGGTTTGPDGGSTGTGTDDGDTTSDGWTTGDGGCAFYGACPDVGDTYECDLWAQDCPSGEKCMPWADDGGDSWNATRCSPIDPNPWQPGDTCHVEGSATSGVDDCDIGMMCWEVDPATLEGVCVELCTGSPDDPSCNDAGLHCNIFNDGVLPLCLALCDPLLQDCPDGEACVPEPADAGFECWPDASGDEGQYGDPCELTNACDPGLVCYAAEFVPGCVAAGGCCTEFCDLTAPDPNVSCSGVVDGAECVPWFEEGQAPFGLQHVGVCSIPP